MGEPMAARYWCHMCSQMVNPVMEVELTCPHCDSGFVEEVDGRGGDMDDQALSLWAPILLGVLGGGSLRRRRIHREEERESSDHDGDSEVEAIRRRRRRTSAILQLLQVIRQGSRAETDASDAESERRRRRDHVILINPFNQAIILRGASDAGTEPPQSQSAGNVGDGAVSAGDYLDALLQRLAENDPSRYGTPPAQKEAVEAMPSVKIEESTSCSICLEELEVGGEARETPCKHRFHGACILPWLELHSSCPVCRFQMPADESKVPPRPHGIEGAAWSLNDLLYLPGPQSGAGGGSLSSSTSSGSNSQPNDN
ncbi:E3 ubiquitin-protein ligase [Canna indica]|uniref:RING-type E3 ubiquitin transferase n=1 Tax=Canna indica TaxID=4628 RepID=A0AAQ3QK72_9LILI|nr:E3 ubiquitin-protein ligase [Canna indica]